MKKQEEKIQQEDQKWGKFWITQKVIFWRSEDKKFLLIKESDPQFIKRWPAFEPWSLPGGHIDENEDVADALKREISEEIGDIEYTQPEVVRVVKTTTGVGVAYVSEFISGEIVHNDEISEFGWYLAEEIQSNEKIHPFVKESIRLAQERLKEKEYLADLKRLQADFENYKRRQAEAQKEMKNFLIEKLVLELIPVLDNFRSANAHVPEASKSDPWAVGVQYIEKQLEDVLVSNGMQTIEVKEGDVFDPRLHEAVSQVSEVRSEEYEVSEENAEENTQEIQVQTVAKVLQKGYRLGKKVVRPAKVVVA